MKSSIVLDLGLWGKSTQMNWKCGCQKTWGTQSFQACWGQWWPLKAALSLFQPQNKQEAVNNTQPPQASLVTAWFLAVPGSLPLLRFQSSLTLLSLHPRQWAAGAIITDVYKRWIWLTGLSPESWAQAGLAGAVMIHHMLVSAIYHSTIRLILV